MIIFDAIMVIIMSKIFVLLDISRTDALQFLGMVCMMTYLRMSSRANKFYKTWENIDEKSENK
jgi:hypothetical protein